MASGEQLKALVKSHVDGDDDRFFSVAMQVAAHEARRGHGRLAEELRTLIDRAKGRLGAGAAILHSSVASTMSCTTNYPTGRRSGGFSRRGCLRPQ